MYAKTNPGAGRLSSGQKRLFGAIGALIVIGLGGLGIWGALTTDSYSSSRNGCVNVTVTNSTGGAVLHNCGAKARAFCQAAYQGHDQISRLARPQCKLAGIAPTGAAVSADPS